MTLTLGEIATMLHTDLEGDPGMEIRGVCGLEDAGPGDITFLANLKYEPLLRTTKASAVIVGPDVPVAGPAILRAADPYLAFGRLLAHFAGEAGHHTGRHRNAVVAPTASVAASAALHAGVVVEADAVIEADCVLYPGVFIGAGSHIGTGALLYPNVVVRGRAHIGARCILHSGVVLGAVGAPPPGAADTDPAPAGPRIILEDDVELGAHTTVDSGVELPTTIGAGTKTDNLVHVGASVTIGPGCLVVAQVGIGPGATIGAGVTLAGQATVLPNVSVGDGAIVAAKAGVQDDLPGGRLYSGTPARPHEEQKQMYAAMRRLPRSRLRVQDLARRLRALEEDRAGG